MFWSSSILATQITAIILYPLIIAFREFAISKYPAEKKQFLMPEWNHEISWDIHTRKRFISEFFFKIIWLAGFAWDFAFVIIYINKSIACIIRESAYNRLFSRGLWTWPPWVICARVLNHKIGNAAIAGFLMFFSSPSLTSGRNNGERNGQSEGYTSR